MFEYLLFIIIFVIDVSKEVLKINNYICRRNDLCHFAEAANPSKELVTDCNISTNDKVIFSVRTINNIGSSTETVNHGTENAGRIYDFAGSVTVSEQYVRFGKNTVLLGSIICE